MATKAKATGSRGGPRPAPTVAAQTKAASDAASGIRTLASLIQDGSPDWISISRIAKRVRSNALTCSRNPAPETNGEQMDMG